MDSLKNYSDSGIRDGISSMRDSVAHLYSNHFDEYTEYVSVSDSDMTGHDNPSFAKQLENLRSLYDSVDTIHCNEDIQGKVNLDRVYTASTINTVLMSQM